VLIADRKSKVKEAQVRLVRADKLQITALDDNPEKLAASLHAILQAIPEIVVAGISTVGRAVIQTNNRKDGGTPTLSWCSRTPAAAPPADAQARRMANLQV
jgi:hypothetical protein